MDEKGQAAGEGGVPTGPPTFGVMPTTNGNGLHYRPAQPTWLSSEALRPDVSKSNSNNNKNNGHSSNSQSHSNHNNSSSCEGEDPSDGPLEVPPSILCIPPLALKQPQNDYTNVTPWVQRLFFVHTYFVYIYVFYMFVLAFYKGYALEYPRFRLWLEMLMLTIIPALQHMRFYFGYWGCQYGLAWDLCLFSIFGSLTMLLLVYFLFFQAYVMPLDTSFLQAAVGIVVFEGFCGCINSLQCLKLATTTRWQVFFLWVSTVSFLGFCCLLIKWEFSPREIPTTMSFLAVPNASAYLSK